MSLFNGFWDLFDLLGIKRPKSSEQDAIQRELDGYSEGIAINKERTSRGNTGKGYNPFDITGGSSQEDLDGAGLTSGLPNLLGALASYFNAMTGADLTNAQKAQNQFNAQQAELQRDWETQMSNTAYQRVVADMQAGGINPAMAWSNGAASTPSGASASAGFASNGLDTLTSLLQLKIQDKLANAQARHLDSETKINEKEAEWVDPLHELEIKRGEAGINKDVQETENLKETLNIIKKSGDKLDAEIKTELKKLDIMASEEALNKAHAALMKMQESQIEKMMPYAIALSKAQTAAQYQTIKNQAQEYTYKSKLYENEDYVDAVIDFAINQAELEGATSTAQGIRNDRDQIKTDIMKGNFLDEEGSWNPHFRYTVGMFDKMLGMLSSILSAGISSLSGLVK